MKALALFPTELVPRPGESGWAEAVADMRAAGFGLWTEAQRIVRDLHNEERRKAIMVPREHKGVPLMVVSWLRSWGHDEEQIASIVALIVGGMSSVEARGVHCVPRHAAVEKLKVKKLERARSAGPTAPEEHP